MDESFYERLQDRLDLAHEFPGTYTFKFIVPKTSMGDLRELMPVGEISLKESSTGKYNSLTLKAHMKGAPEVISIYKSVADIPGVISL